ncbi:MAG: thioredoxin family protein [Anaerolineales bacterium]|nr:thioredoxin family protein [Anaerolineales bacterium]
MLNIKILGVRHPERYAVRRSVLSAQNELQAQYPDLAVEIAEIKDPGEIGKYALVLILPSLVVNEKLVCTGRFPAKKEVLGWLLEAMGKEN